MIIEVDYYINKAAYDTVNDTSYCGLQPYKLYTTLTIKTIIMTVKKKVVKKKPKGLKYYVTKMDTYFHRYIRLKNTDKEGKGECYTCETPLEFKRSQCGHFMGREHKATR